MAVTGALVELSVPGRITSRVLQLTFTGSYTNQANGGEILDLAKITNNSIFDGFKTFSARRPLMIYPVAMSGAFYFELIPVANQNLQYIVKIYTGGGTEIANATAYTASVGASSAGKSLASPDSPCLVGFDVITGA
ncbi:MAG: hypothetical protein M3O09_09610 [Acidobacteriota bacterium]|nr:hypothetical protein [Acidobacteriota bacterium]